jgi:PAS domain S-box-containing protein
MKQRTPSSFTAPLDQPAWLRYGFAALMLLAAQGTRWLLDPYMGDAMPLSTIYIAVASTVCFSGWKPAALLAITGYVASMWMFAPPRLTFKILDDYGTMRLSVYAVTCAITILLCEMIRRARKRHALSETKVLSILENMRESFCSVDTDWRITSVNRSAESCLGRTRAELLGQSIWAVLPRTMATLAETKLRLAMGERTPVQFETNTFVTGVWHDITATRTDGELSIFFQDITAKRAHVDQLERLVDDRTAALQRIVADLEGFSYTLVHDMRAPLRSISGFAELLAVDHGEQLNVEGKRHVSRIQYSAARMDQLIVDILAYSQLSRTQPDLRDINLDETIRDILKSQAEFQLDQADIEVEATLPFVRGNDALLTQCFSNLLHNATKFVAPGVRPRIRISSLVRGDVARIEIADNGIGVAPEAFGRIFEPFRREHAHYDGTGIGLAIVQKVVEQLHGRVGVDSEPGQGSRFWVELKLTSPSPASPPGHTSSRVLV